MCHQRESHVFDDVQCTMYNVQGTRYNVQCTRYNVQCTITIHTYIHTYMYTVIHVYMYYIQTHMMQTSFFHVIYRLSMHAIPPWPAKKKVKAGAPDASLILVVPYQPHQDEQCLVHPWLMVSNGMSYHWTNGWTKNVIKEYIIYIIL